MDENNTTDDTQKVTETSNVLVEFRNLEPEVETTDLGDAGQGDEQLEDTAPRDDIVQLTLNVEIFGSDSLENEIDKSRYNLRPRTKKTYKETKEYSKKILQVATRIKQEAIEEERDRPVSTRTEALNDSEAVNRTDIKNINLSVSPTIEPRMTSLPTTLIETFDCDNNLNLAVRWNQWLKRLEQYFTATRVTDDAQKEATLFLFGGSRLFEIHESLPEAVTDEVADTNFKKAVHRLNNYFNPKRNKVFETFIFSQAKQEKSETIDQYVTRLRALSKYCEFNDADEEIMKQVIRTCISKELRKRFLERDNLNLKEMLNLGRTYDSVRSQLEVFDGKNESREESIAMLGHKNASRNKYKFNKNFTKNTDYIKKTKCYNCGGSYPHKNECPAKGKKCNQCGKMNHFAKFCKSKGKKVKDEQQVNQIKESKQKQDINQLNDDKDYLFALDQTSTCPRIKLDILGNSLSFKIDTGASVNVIDMETFDKMKNKPELEPYTTPIYAYGVGNPLICFGSFKAKVSVNGKEYFIEFKVMNGKSGCLLSYNTSSNLKLIQILNKVEEVDNGKYNNLEHWRSKYPELFTGMIGKLKNFQLKLHIDETVKPVQAKPRHKPFHLREAIDKQIQSKLEQDLIEEVVGEPTDWLSETVVTAKKGTSEIRICTDMKAANKAIKRERYEMPNAEDIIYKTNGMKVFSLVDLISAFEQIELHPKSRYISRFRTHKGIFQNKRLFFGISAAPEIFHQILSKILEGIVNCQNAIDDILIMTVDESENYDVVNKVLQILLEHGLTVNPKKCIFGAKEITFFGLRLSADGVSLSEQKVQALREFNAPDNASELHSFLGLSNYASRWIPNLAVLAEPLWHLTKKNIRWEWSDMQQAIFDKIKNGVIESVGYYKLDWNTSVHVDASIKGLSAVLTQENPKDTEQKQIVICISRSLSDVEKRYSQIELEALSPVWALERLELYLIAVRFKLYIDNRAVALIYNNPLARPPARILRWGLRLSPYDFEVIHTPGLGNIADFLSRHPMKLKKEDLDDTSEFIDMIVKYTVPKSVTLEKIVEETLKDVALTKLRKMIIRNKFNNDNDVKSFKQVFSELSISNENLVLRGLQIVIPESLQDDMVNIAHEGHLGIVKTKQLLRSKIWFPGIDKLVEDKIKTCLTCQAVEPSGGNIAPLAMTEMPNKPWEKVAIDFFGPIPPTNEYIQVVYDKYSRIVFPRFIPSTSFKSVEKELEKLFSDVGIPEEVTSDNGPPFNGEEFKKFAELYGFKHRLVTPYWPMANGMVESFMKRLGKVVKTAKLDGVSWKTRVFDYVRNYKSTPHSSTGVAPNDLFFRNAKTTKLPDISKFKMLEIDKFASRNDSISKSRMKKEADKRLGTKEIQFNIGDEVLVKQKQLNKTMSRWDPKSYHIVSIKGNMISAKRHNHLITRNVSFFKRWEGNSNKFEIR
ncbi:unnamed protein product, partial [Brachionus calyciflorus]